jgi:hypothetical protein
VCGFGVKKLEIPGDMLGLRSLRKEQQALPKVIVSSLSLGHFVVGLRLSSMDDIRELDSVLDEEDWDIVANNVPVTLLCVELHRWSVFVEFLSEGDLLP